MTETIKQLDERDTLRALLEDDFCDFTYGRGVYRYGDEVEGGCPGKFTTVSIEFDEPRRWSRYGTVIVSAPSGKLFRFVFDEALTEMGEDEYEGQFVEVVAEIRTVEVIEYRVVG